MALVNQDLYLEITPGTIPPILNVTEYDENMQVIIHLRQRGQAYEIPSGTTAKVEGTLAGHPFRVAATPASGEDTVTFELSEAMTGYAGRAWTKIKLIKDNKPVHTCGFWLNCDRAGVEAGDVVAMTGFEQQLKDGVYDYLDDHQLASIAFLPKDLLPQGTDIDNVIAPGCYLLGGATSFGYLHNPLPTGHTGALFVYQASENYGVQIICDISDSEAKTVYKRSRRTAYFTGAEWVKLIGENEADYTGGVLQDYGIEEYIWQNPPVSSTHPAGVTFTVNDDASITINGTPTATAYISLYATAADVGGLASWVEAGKRYRGIVNSGNSLIRLQCYSRDVNGTSTLILDTATEQEFEFPADAFSMNLRIAIPSPPSGTSFNNVTIRPFIIPAESSTIPELKSASTTQIKILCIGNSYTQDCTAYTPFLIDKLADINGDKVNITFGASYYSGARIDQYNDWFDNESAMLTYYKRINNKDAYETAQQNKTIQQILADEDWDIITVQQGSSYAGEADTFSGLNDLIDKIINYCTTTHGKPVKLGWLMPQLRVPLPSGHNFTYSDVVDCIQNEVLAKTPIDFVIPCGTAVENARRTSLDSLGDNGHMTADSNGHLQEGLPVLLACYVSTLKFLELMGMPYHGILGDTTRPTQAWVTSHNIPGQNGTSTGVTDANCLLAQKCAVAAMKKPFEITEVSV